MSGGGERGGVHAREQVLGPWRGPSGGGVGEASTTPLEDEGQGGEGEGEEGKEEEELRDEGVGRGG